MFFPPKWEERNIALGGLQPHNRHLVSSSLESRPAELATYEFGARKSHSEPVSEILDIAFAGSVHVLDRLTGQGAQAFICSTACK